MKKVNVLGLNKENKGDVLLPVQFSEPVREDLIKRAVVTIENNKRQSYGSAPKAGMRHSAELSRRRKKYRGSYGHGISRVPRKILTRRGTRFFWVGAVAPGTVGGRRAHPPKAEKIWDKKLNVKERRKAIRSAMAATMNKQIVEARGHTIPAEYPFIISSDLEKVEKTKEVMDILEKLGFGEELKRTSEKKIRAGKGTMRGRKYKTVNGPLVVVSDKCKIQVSARNIPGLKIVNVKYLNTMDLAPGANPGRVTIFTEAAIKKIAEEKLFSN